jgi:DNA invertase Pin-like site-specific DNA recombinase
VQPHSQHYRDEDAFLVPYTQHFSEALEAACDAVKSLCGPEGVPVYTKKLSTPNGVILRESQEGRPKRRPKRDAGDPLIPGIKRKSKRQSMAFGYLRVSTADQYSRDNSPSAQRDSIDRYYQYNLKPQGIPLGDVIDDGKGISARYTSFFLRPAGARLLAQLQPGDHLIFTKIDRMWRNLNDFCSTFQWLEENGITMHIVNLGGSSFNTSSPSGRMMMQVLATFGEFESRMIGERIRDALTSKRRKAEYDLGISMGTRFVKQDGGRDKIVWSPEDRQYMRLLVELRDNFYFTFSEAVVTVDAHRRRVNGLPPASAREFKFLRGQFKDKSPVSNASSRYYYEKGLEVLAINDVTDLPLTIALSKVGRHHSPCNTPKWRGERASLIKSLGGGGTLTPIGAVCNLGLVTA